MRKIVRLRTAASFGVISLVALTNAEARFGAGMIAEASAGSSTAQSAQYYGGYAITRGMATAITRRVTMVTKTVGMR